ncbi:FMN-binding negative transcriptional regulator [Rhodocista pekingensis]|uniref:FMN-binding negative transcriptional regulator n=1 Tax=Rhodocista pekingensis TaxID=201185 RepID=A0ABW2KVI4_9PROT
MAPPFQPADPAEIAALIEAHPLAWVVAHGPAGFAAAPLPLLADLDADGNVVRLVGHMAKRGRLAAVLAECPRALILFQGPEGYISPAWVRDRTWGPTWNYAVVQIEADIVLCPDQTDAALIRLAEQMERPRGNGWVPADMGRRYEGLSRAIVAFHAEVRSLDARFKLGQDERPEILEDILAALPADGELAAAMRRNNPRR